MIDDSATRSWGRSAKLWRQDGAERDLKKIMKRMTKDRKKPQKAGSGNTPEKAVVAESAAKGDTSGELAALKAELAEVREKKKQAAEEDKFKVAKGLKRKE